MTDEQWERARELRVIMKMHDLDGIVDHAPVVGSRKDWRIVYFPYAGAAKRYIYYSTFEGAERGVHRLLRRVKSEDK